MGRSARRELLARTLNSHAQTIHETFQLFDEAANPHLEKVDWSDVTKLGDEVSKQATITGMLWTGEVPDGKELEENIETYCNVLQGFLLLCHGSTVGAGPTLHACVHSSAKQIIDCSLSLLKEAVSSYGSHASNKKMTIPQLSGSVWEACTALKRTPNTNCMAIGRALTQVAVSVKDVLREMRELKPAATDSGDENPETFNTIHESHEEDSDSEGALGSDLSPEEMNIALLAIGVVSDTLVVIKEAIRFITNLIKKPIHGVSAENHVPVLERILKYYQETGVQVDELGACLYPPQEVSSIRAMTEKMLQITNGIRTEVQNIEGSAEGLVGSLEALDSSLRKLQLGVVCLDTGIVKEIESLAV